MDHESEHIIAEESRDDPGDPRALELYLHTCFFGWNDSRGKEESERWLNEFSETAEMLAAHYPAMSNKLWEMHMAMMVSGGDRHDPRRRWPEFFTELCNASAGQQPPKSDEIPPDKRTRPMTKKEAAKILRPRDNPKAAVRWLTQSIEDGSYRFEKLPNSYKGYFHLDDDWPAGSRDKLKG